MEQSLRAEADNEGGEIDVRKRLARFVSCGAPGLVRRRRRRFIARAFVAFRRLARFAGLGEPTTVLNLEPFALFFTFFSHRASGIKWGEKRCRNLSTGRGLFLGVLVNGPSRAAGRFFLRSADAC